MLTAEQALFASNHCIKYPLHDFNYFLKCSINSKHILLNDCCLIQYDDTTEIKDVSFIMFDSEKCDFKLSTYKNIRDWFRTNNIYLQFKPLKQFKKILGIK